MPQPGFFVLHRYAKPPLTAGEYVLHAEHAVASWAAAPLDSRIAVTSPRYTLPPDQLLGVYPPANAAGEFGARLPQVVIKRRTLAWERDADPDPARPGESLHPSHPWMALVVVRADECSLEPSVGVEQAVSDGVHHTGERDVDRCMVLSVAESVVDKVFPTVEELPLLCHVREVDQRDTELAMGDDDGWLAVVLANRLPVADTDEHGEAKAVRYLAALVNLEGQFANLPTPAPPVFDFVSDILTLEAHQLVAETGAAEVDHLATSAGSAITAVGASYAGVRAQPSGAAHTAADWQIASDRIDLAASVGVDAGANVRRAIVDEFVGGPMIRLPLERVLRFPVLMCWSFTTVGLGGFDAYMQGLDVGLLGTAPPPPPSPPPPAPGQPPTSAPPAAARPPLETVETGHVGLPHVTRRGATTRAWYRGPFVARPVERPGRDASNRYPLAHVSDQLRVMTPDGREDLSRAAAFEIGRLLALAQPSIVAALLRWRTGQFGAARARRGGEIAVGLDFLLDIGEATTAMGRLVSHRLLDAIGEVPQKVFAPLRPVVDPGRPLAYVGRGEALSVLAEGLGLDAAALVADGHVDLSQRMVDLATGGITNMDSAGPVADRTLGVRLDAALREEVGRVADDVLAGRGVDRRVRRSTDDATGSPGGAAGAEVLDELLWERGRE